MKIECRFGSFPKKGGPHIKAKMLYSILRGTPPKKYTLILRNPHVEAVSGYLGVARNAGPVYRIGLRFRV